MKTQERDHIRRVYSILPDIEVDLAVDDTLRTLESTEVEGWKHQLKWAEFSKSGAVLRSGVTDMVARVTTIISEHSQDEEVANLVDEVQANGLEAGRIVYFPKRDEFIWFLPVAPLGSDALSEWHVKGFIVTEMFFSDLVRHLNPRRRITPAESRVTFQLIAGATLREAAEHDALSVDTKRAQIKSAAAKLDCAGQTDLVRVLIGQLSHITAISNSQSDANDDAEGFVARHLGNDVNLSVHRLGNGRLIRILECGQSDASPVIVIHGILFPNTIFGASEHLKRNNLKLVIPLRRGYLETPRKRVSDNYVFDAIEDIALYIEKSFSAPPLVMGQSYGGPIALAFASAFPERVKALMMLSAHFGNAPHRSDSHASHFFGGFRRVIHDNAMVEAIALQFAKHYVKPSRARKILVRLFQGNECDLSILEGHLGRPPSYDWFIDLYQRSLTAISDDFRFTMGQRTSEIKRPECNLSFLHAEGDPLSSIKAVSDIAESLDADMLHLPREAGHFAAASHPEAVWNSVGKWVRKFSAF